MTILSIDYKINLEDKSEDFYMHILTTIHDINNIKKLSSVADGFLLGVKRFSKTLTFDFSQNLYDAILEIKSLKKSVFILLNKMFTDEELDDVRTFILDLPSNLIDGFITADIGLLSIFEGLNLLDKLIYNPETLLTNNFDFNYLSDQKIMGAFVSKEITLLDILEIGKHKAYKLFMFGHGHLSMFYSKRQILSAFSDHLNQPSVYHEDNNLLLKEEKRESELYPVLEDQAGTHVFRGLVMSSIDDINPLSEYVDYLIVDTLFQDDDYALNVIPMYQKKCLDEATKLIVERNYSEKWHAGFLHKKSLIKDEQND